MGKKSLLTIDNIQRKVKGGYITDQKFISDNLPSGFTRLNYIESNGTQYINSGFKPNQDTRVIIDYQISAAQTIPLFGARNGIKNQEFEVFAYSDNIGVQDGYGNQQDYVTSSANLDRNIIDKNKNVTMSNDGTLNRINTYHTFQCDYNMYIFGMNNAGTLFDADYGSKIFYCKIYDNGTLIRDYIPCINANGKAGLYDLVNKQFYGNEGTGEFTYIIDNTKVHHKIKKAFMTVNGVHKLVFQDSVSLADIPVGGSVFMNVSGTPTEFIVVHQGIPDATIYDASCNGTWLLMKHVYGDDMSFGTNVDDFQSSDVRLELNDVIFFEFDEAVQNLIKQIKIPHYSGSNTSGTVMSGTNGLPSKLFLLSGYEVGWTVADGAFPENEGATLDYFKDTAEIDKRRSVTRSNGEATSWWLRSTCTDSYKRAWDIYDGDAWNDTFNTLCGVRPALILPETVSLDSNFNVVV